MSESVVKELKRINKEAGHREFFRHLIYCHFSWRLVRFLLYTKITPNLITVISTLLAFVASIFYFKADYASLVIGTIFLNLSYIFDCADGELSRYKKISSKFGAWLDSVCDVIVEYAVLASLMLGFYFKTANPTVLILGFFALANLLLIITIRNLNRIHFDSKPKKGIKPKHEFSFSGNFIGGAETFTVLVTVFTLLNQVYYLLLIYAVLGTLIWVKQVYRRVVSYHKV